MDRMAQEVAMDDRARASGASGPVDPARDIAERLAKLRGLSVRLLVVLQVSAISSTF